MKLKAYLFTNGRSTFEHSLRTTKEQRSLKGIEVLSREILVDALNEALEKCETSHFVKVDDDFVFHPRAFEYMWRRFTHLSNRDQIGIFSSHLWEDWTNKPISGVKIYSVKALKYVGGFIADRHGKVDKIVSGRLVYSGYSIFRDSSVVGLHTCGSWDEQLKYESIWNRQARVVHRKSTRDEMQQYSKPLSEQVKLRTNFIEQYNIDQETKFGKWLIRRRKKEQV